MFRVFDRLVVDFVKGWIEASGTTPSRGDKIMWIACLLGCFRARPIAGGAPDALTPGPFGSWLIVGFVVVG